MRRLPPLNALRAFEAAARHASFRAAAAELAVTPAAISHQIKALEGDLGCNLFLRMSRGVELTEKGAFLFVAVQRGLETISDAVTHMRDRPETADVTIRTTTAVSSLWLTPKISAFWKSHPTVAVSQIVSDVPTKSVRCDLSIQYGDPKENLEECHKLFQDRIVALGTPRFAAEHGIGRVEDLLNAPLIHMDNEETDWTNWPDWFQALGHTMPKGRRFSVNNYMIALQAAQDDIGAVLGWDELVKSLIEQGRLVTLVPENIPSPMAFYLKIQPRAGSKARLFASWLTKSS